jgi:4-amino-4-deoxy-L-arabinose transferase-like glycosyltransferase
MNGRTIDLSKYLHAGDNKITLVVENWNADGGFSMRASPWDEIVFKIHFAFLSIILFLIWQFMRTYRLFERDIVLTAIGTSGVFFRFVYFLMTAYSNRSHDVDAHIEYIFYVLKHFTIPSQQSGWEMYQPPLYYFLAALWLLPAKIMGAATTTMLDLLQIQTFIISSIAFLIGMWIGCMLFPNKHERQQRWWFAAFLAVIPGIIFSASQITNDTLIFLEFLLFVAFLYRYWLDGKLRDWWISLVILALGILTKSNMIPLLVPAFTCLLLRERGWSRIYIVIQSCSILVIATGWYFILRFLDQHQPHLVGNVMGDNEGLFIVHWHFINLFILNPFRVLQFPYFSPWDDLSGRPYLPEVLLKSAFMGEWNYGVIINNVMRLFYSLNFLLLFIGLVAFVRQIITSARKNLPIWLSGICSVLAIMALEANIHNGGWQDFRYATLLVIPVTYYVIQGIENVPASMRGFLKYLYGMHLSILLIYFYLLVRTSPLS